MKNTESKNTYSFTKMFVTGEMTLGIWAYIKKAVGVFDSFFILKSLSLYSFGVYQLLLSFYAIASDFFHDVFAGIIGNDLSRLIGEGKESEAKRLFIENVLFRLIMALIPAVTVFACSSLIARLYGSEMLVWAFLLAFLFIADAVMYQALLLLKIRLEFSVLATRPTIQKSIQFFLLAYFFFFATLGIREIFIVQLLTPVVTLLLFLRPIVRAYAPWKKILASTDSMLVPAIRTYGKWSVPQALTTNLVGKIRPSVIKLFFGTETVGIFGVAYTALSMLKDLLPTRTLTVLMPRSAHEKKKLDYFYLYGTKYYTLLSLALLVVGVIVYPIGINFIFPQYTDSIWLFFLLAPSLVFFAFIKITNILLMVQRRQKFIFSLSFVEHGLGLVLLVLFLNFFGIIGLPLAESVAIFLASALKYTYLVRTGFISPFKFSKLFTFGVTDREIFLSGWNHLSGHLRTFFART